MALVLNKKVVAGAGSGLKITQSMKKESLISHMIHRELAGWEEPRSSKNIHASDLFKDHEFCPRERAFIDMGLVKVKPSFIGTALKITFAHGRNLEYSLRNEWLRKYMVGFWECGACGHNHEVFGKAPKVKCPVCTFNQWRYKEVRVLDAESGVSGGIDGFVDMGEMALRVLELKSMDKDEHKKLIAPLAEHKVRTALYLKLLSVHNAPWVERVNKSVASILYISKSFGFKDESLKAAGIVDAPFSPFKEYQVERDDSLFGDVLNRAKALTHWRKGECSSSGLPAGVCPNGLCNRAQKCSAVSPCWSGNYPSTITWIENGKPAHPGKPVTV